jgi:hypothetical protein
MIPTWENRNTRNKKCLGATLFCTNLTLIGPSSNDDHCGKWLANNRRPLTHEYKSAKFLDIRKHIALFAPSQAAPACSSQKRVLGLNMEQRWNDTDRVKPKYSRNNQSQSNLIQHKSHVKWLRIELWSPH